MYATLTPTDQARLTTRIRRGPRRGESRDTFARRIAAERAGSWSQYPACDNARRYNADVRALVGNVLG